MQPYVGAGLGVLFVNVNYDQYPGGADVTGSDTAVGFNALAGLRFLLTDHIALFGEYKYSRAHLDIGLDVNDIESGVTVEGDYSINMLVGGISYHF